MAAAATSAVTPAATQAVNPGDLVNVPAGAPATERWPAALDPQQYTDTGPVFAIEGPPQGDWIAGDYAGAAPQPPVGGGIQDTSWVTGTDAPQADWDTAGGQPVTPNLTAPGALPPELHATDTGAVFQKEYVIPAAIGELSRQTGTGQTWNREYRFEPVQGQYVTDTNDRVNFDQRQVWDPAPGDGGGWAPWDPGYAERPVLLNVAYQATPVTEEGGIYGVSGALPDRAPFQAYQASAYESPPDPLISQPAAPAASGAGGWLLG